MGGQIGSTFDVTISGDHLDEAGQLVFTHPGLKAQPKIDAAGKSVPNQYTIVVAPDCPQGIHEARVMSRLGVSSARVFSRRLSARSGRAAKPTLLWPLR